MSKLRRVFSILMPVVVLVGVGIYTATLRRTFVTTACSPDSYGGQMKQGDLAAIYKGEKYNVAQVAGSQDSQKVLGVAAPADRWIEVDLSDQVLKAWNGDELYLETSISSGLPWWPTPTGEFRIWVKLRATKMEGGEGRNYYNLPNVPYVMFFENEDVPGWRGYGLHGTYWHNDFGNQRSHGCVNLPTETAQKLYNWVTPEIPDGKYSVWASESNPGTRIVIHD